MALTIPIAIAINGFRVFLTGFLVLYVSPEMGEGFMHTSEGMLMFGGAFLITALVAWVLGYGEKFVGTFFNKSVVVVSKEPCATKQFSKSHCRRVPTRW